MAEGLVHIFWCATISAGAAAVVWLAVSTSFDVEELLDQACNATPYIPQIVLGCSPQLRMFTDIGCKHVCCLVSVTTAHICEICKTFHPRLEHSTPKDRTVVNTFTPMTEAEIM